MALNPTAAAIMAAAQPHLPSLMPQPVASPQPVAVPMSMAGMMLQGGQLIPAGSQPVGIPQAGAPVMVASQSVTFAAALAGQPQPMVAMAGMGGLAGGAATLPAGASLIPGLARPVLVRQAAPGLPGAMSLAGLRAIPTAAGLPGQQLVAHHPGLPAALGGVPASMLGGLAAAGLPGLPGAPAGLPPGVMLGPPMLLPSRLPRPM